MRSRDLILQYIINYFEEHCYAPSYEEICAEVGLSKGTVHTHMKKLFLEGHLENDFVDDFSKPRAFRPKGYICIKGRS